MKWSLGVAALVVLSGCSTLHRAPSAHLGAKDPLLQECAQWYRDLDRRVEEAGTRDVQETRLDGFPYLRVNRLLASYRDTAARNDDGLPALVERMQQLDLAARRAEISNSVMPFDEALLNKELARARQCADALSAADLADAGSRRALVERVRVPDAYSTGKRALGLYALTRVPFSAGVRRHQAEVLASFSDELSVPPGAQLALLAPPAAQPSNGFPTDVLARAAANPLGIPEVSDAELEQLFAANAPEFEIEVTGEFDRAGALEWKAGDRTPAVDVANPVVYRNVAWTRYGERTLLQLVYTVWFTERPRASRLDMLAGQLDGLTWRVTLAPDGEPLLYDTIHPCGCYHMFFPTPRAVPVAAPEGAVEFMFSPQSLPRLQPGERPRLRIATRTHYLKRVSIVPATSAESPYRFVEYDTLRSLPRPDGTRASLFGDDGLVAGSQRPERLLFWPMGIDSAGAMRQWGHHATAFVGRRHFDDADLIEKRFKLALD